MTKQTKEQFQFKTEVKQLLDLVIHSLYSHKDIFLRELISNAADAIDRLRFESLTNSDLLPEGHQYKIKILRDDKNKQLTVADSGIGMSHDELTEHLGTIAKSGTKAFLEQIKANKEKQEIDLIGQFGVGFYSSFMVADKVTVISKKAQTDKAYKWTSAGEGGFTIEEAQKDSIGTDIILDLKKDSEEYLSEWELKNVIKKYSNFVEHPIVIDVEREEKPRDKDGKEIEKAKPVKFIEEETINSQKAIWSKAKSQVSEEEYKEFYKHISHDYSDPLKTIHYSAEGKIEFKALLYLPAKAPMDLFNPDTKRSIQLYVKRVFIMDDCKNLIPEYLRFVKGVVDSADLPLNVSREILQQDAQLEKIKKNLVNKILSTLSTMKEKNYDEYVKFYNEFGRVLKEGIHYDFENKEKILDLCLFQSTKTASDTYHSLQQYIDSMEKNQKEIYYLTAESEPIALSSPHLEKFKSKNIEVLLLTDPIDEWVIGATPEYKGKKLKAVDKGDADIVSNKEEEKARKKKQEESKDLLEYIQKQLDANVKEVRFTSRLTDSACCLVAEEHGMNKHMEQMFKAMGQEMPTQKKILELNPDNELVKVVENRYNENKESEDLNEYVSLLYDQALIAEGSQLKYPLDFVKKINKIMVKASKIS